MRRILVQMDRFGLLDGSAPERGEIDVEADAAVALDVATAGAVLLTNERRALPLDRRDLKGLAVIGPTAASPLVGGGGSARVTPFRAVSALDALIEQAGPRAEITYAPGIDLDGEVVPDSALTLTGTVNDATVIDFTGDDALPAGNYRWDGTIDVPSTGEYDLHVQVDGGGGALSIDGAQVLSVGSFFGGSLIPTADGLTNNTAVVDLEAGTHTITLTRNAGFFGATSLATRLTWVTPERRQAVLDEATRVAGEAEAVVVFGYNEGTEGADRSSLSLPGRQDELIEAAAASADRRTDTIVVLNTGDPVTMPWIDDVQAVLEMWYPGQEGGAATAALLLGEANPGGKLPVTFPADEADPLADLVHLDVEAGADTAPVAAAAAAGGGSLAPTPQLHAALDAEGDRLNTMATIALLGMALLYTAIGIANTLLMATGARLCRSWCRGGRWRRSPSPAS